MWCHDKPLVKVKQPLDIWLLQVFFLIHFLIQEFVSPRSPQVSFWWGQWRAINMGRWLIKVLCEITWWVQRWGTWRYWLWMPQLDPGGSVVPWVVWCARFTACWRVVQGSPHHIRRSKVTLAQTPSQFLFVHWQTLVGLGLSVKTPH